MDGRLKDIYIKFQEIKRSLLTPEDIEIIEGEELIRISGWGKIKSALGLSNEIKLSERIETGNNGVKKILWRYIIRVSTQDGIFSEGEGVCSSDELEGKPENFISYIAQARALSRAISFLLGIINMSADEILPYPTKKGKVKEGLAIPEEIAEEWHKKEKSLEKEMRIYSDVLSTQEEKQNLYETNKAKVGEPEEEMKIEKKKLTSIQRREIFSQIGEFLNRLGTKTPEEKREYVSKILKRQIVKSSELQDEELLLLYETLKREVEKKLTR
jgi:hypothetical protein